MKMSLNSGCVFFRDCYMVAFMCVCFAAQMNTGAMHSSGALLLEPVNHLMLTAKVTDHGDPISLHYQDTPLNKIRGERVLHY